MPAHDFKSIQVVPSGKELLDIVLSKTQRKTPTVIHKSAQIGTHRKFYIRKVKTCQQNFHDKIDKILKDFPVLDNLHKFHANLMNTLYGETEYKQALSHLNYIKSKIDRISKDHTKLIKFGDSQYRCKTLKRVALGKMAKLILKSTTKASLLYLEECRQHLSRFPTIDTSTRTVILCGFPNVGKSSFLNRISRADVDVQPYAFTTKSLFVGHCDHENLRWQFIDTPGLLDRPLAECNTSEMLAVTALDALEDAGVLFLVDLSEQCGYSIRQQLGLLGNIRALFGNKPLVVGLNKIDEKSLADIDPEDRALIEAVTSTPGQEVRIVAMSTRTEEGVMAVRDTACQLVLTARVAQKLAKPAVMESRHRLYIANKRVRAGPTGGDGDGTDHIPADVRARLEQQALLERENPGAALAGAKKTLFQRQKDEGNRFVYDCRDEWQLEKPADRYDVIPEVYQGHNIADFGYIDAAALERLRAEEKLFEETGYYDIAHEPLPEATRSLAKTIREAEDMKKLDSIEKTNTTGRKTINRCQKKITLETVQQGMKKLGVDVADDAAGLARARSRSANRSTSRKRVEVSALRSESISRCHPSRSRSRSGIKDEKTAAIVRKMSKVSQRKNNRMGKLGESDRHIGDTKPRHLNTGKRGVGKADRR